MSLKKLFVIALASISGLFYATSCKEAGTGEQDNITVELGDAVIGEDNASATVTAEYTVSGNPLVVEAGVVYGIKDAGEAETITVKAENPESPFTVTLSGLKEAEYEYYAYVKAGDDVYESETKAFAIVHKEKVLAPSEMAKAIRTLEDGAILSSYGDYVEGVVTANNESGNISSAMIVEDGTGAAGSGLYLYEYNMEQFNVGDKVRIALKNAKLKIYSGLYEIVWDADVYNGDVTLVSSGNTFTTPEITIAEMENYREMFVKVKNLKLDATENRPWSGNVTFTDGTDKVTVRSGSKTPWAGKYINAEYTGTMAAVVGYYNSIQLLPVNENDIKEFMGEAPVENNVYEWELQKGDFGTTDAPETALTKGTPELAWTVDYNWKNESGYIGFDTNDSKKGVQFGSSGNPISSVALETTATDLNVAKVKVNASMASNGDMTLQVFSDGTALGEPLKMTNTATEYTFNLPAAKKGAVIKIEMKATVKACYIKSIKFE